MSNVANNEYAKVLSMMFLWMLFCSSWNCAGTALSIGKIHVPTHIFVAA